MRVRALKSIGSLRLVFGRAGAFSVVVRLPRLVHVKALLHSVDNNTRRRQLVLLGEPCGYTVAVDSPARTISPLPILRSAAASTLAQDLNCCFASHWSSGHHDNQPFC